MKKLTVRMGLGMFLFLLAGCAVSMGDDFILPGNEVNSGTEYGAYITEYNLEAYVPIPYTGEVPVVQVAHRGDLDAAVIWKDAKGNSLNNLTNFVGGVVYRAEIKITPKNGYVFYSTQSFGYRAGRVTTQGEEGGSSERTVTVTYRAAQERPEDEDLGFEFFWMTE
jgi:hypothetical protein